MNYIENFELETPFSRKLRNADRRPTSDYCNQKKLWKIQKLEGIPEKLVRTREFPRDSFELKEIQMTKPALDKARSFGINIPDAEIVIGPSDKSYNMRIYTIVDKIHGFPLDDVPLDEHFQYDQFFNACLPHLVEYGINVYQNGGKFFCDLEKPGEMFMYGKRTGDAKDQIWLVDVDLADNVKKNSFRILQSLAERYWEVFGLQNLPIAKSILINFLQSISGEDRNYQAALSYLKKIEKN
jgi:hypothetical protein